MTFTERQPREDIATVRDRHAPDALILDAESDFQTLSTPALDELATLVDEFSPHVYEEAWLPPEVPTILDRLVDGSAPVGAPGDGAVTWTRTTSPPTVIVKPRVEGSPDDFVAFLIAEALVAAGSDEPEHFLGLFEDQYRTFSAALDVDSTLTYQMAAGCATAYRGLAFHPIAKEWTGDLDALYEAWTTAGEQIAPRVGELRRAVLEGDTGIGDATELACGAIKHGIEPPAPFDALADDRFREFGAEYAVAWADQLET